VSVDGSHTDEGWDEVLDHLADRRRASRAMGGDELIDPREIRNVLLASPERALHRRQQAAEPVARIGIAP
jgi:hypothetical protein